MHMNTTHLIQKFAPVLTASQAPVNQDPRLLMDRDGNLSIYYAPFEYVNPSARVVLVGITPGPTQMVNANSAARTALLAGSSPEDAVGAGKATGAFSGGVLRRNLVGQLNDWGVHTWLGLSDASALFGSAGSLVQTTSLLRFPVFNAGHEYGGNPDMTRTPLLRRYLQEHFVREVEQLPNAVFLPLGPKVAKVLATLVREGLLDGNRVEAGLLHPSGNCTYRINYLLSDRQGAIPHATNPTPYDEGRRSFRERYLGIQAVRDAVQPDRGAGGAQRPAA